MILLFLLTDFLSEVSLLQVEPDSPSLSQKDSLMQLSRIIIGSAPSMSPNKLVKALTRSLADAEMHDMRAIGCH